MSQIGAPKRPAFLEVFTSAAEVSTIAAEAADWDILEPVGIDFGDDLFDPDVRKNIGVHIRIACPDLVVVSPPVGP